MEKDRYIIYALVDPSDYRVRYIGQTRVGYNRFYQHLMLNSGNKAKDAWIKRVSKSSHPVIMEVLDKASTLSVTRDKEAFWIEFFRTVRPPVLTNISKPPSPIPQVSEKTPGTIEIYIPAMHAEYVSREIANDEGFVKTRVHNALNYEEFKTVSLIISVDGKLSWYYLILKWARRFLADGLIRAYRFKMWKSEWATFGDEIIVHACDDRRLSVSMYPYWSVVYE